MKSITKAIGAALVALGLVLGSAGVAQAVGTRALATDNKLFGLDGVSDSNWGTLHQLNELTGSSSTVGTRGTYSPFGFPYQAAFDPSRNSIFWINSDFNTGAPSYLMKTNPTTGQATLIGEFLDGSTAVGVDSMAVSASGLGYAIAGPRLFQINMATGALTLINGQLQMDRIYSFAFNPANSKFYVLSNDSMGGLAELNVTNGTMTPLIPIGNFPDLGAGTSWGAKRTYSIAFDQNGSMWGVNIDGDLFTTLVTGTNAADFITGVQTVGTPGQSATNSIAITYPVSSNETLANTGGKAELQFANLALAVLALSAGAVLIAISRRRMN